MKMRFIGILCLVACALTLTAAMFSEPNKSVTQVERAELIMRKIGHNLLLHAGDSTSRVMPVKKLGSSSFQLEFENKFSFMPDSLASIVYQSIASTQLPTNYIVRVFDSQTDEMVHGFEITALDGSANACMGRVQPSGHYTVQITFTEPLAKEESYAAYYLGLFGCLGILLLFVAWPKSTLKASPEAIASSATKLGVFTFDEITGSLKHGDSEVALSNKESKLLTILVAKRNEVIDRDHLQNEVWGSEGVITGRSLDMFISKLRKKLSEDPTIKIVNIHGRGYKLEVT